jgi:hypothetical protein
MKISDVIAMVDDLKANRYSTAQKIRWLSECDSTIFDAIISMHKLPEGMPERFPGYTEQDMDTELIVKAPHDILYRYCLEMQIDLYNKELGNYNNTSRLFNTAMATYSAWYTRNNMPLEKATHFKL